MPPYAEGLMYSGDLVDGPTKYANPDVTGQTLVGRPPMVIIIEFVAAAQYLGDFLKRYDPEPAYYQSVLSLIITDVMNYANQWADTTSFEAAIEEIVRVVRNPDLAFEIARVTGDMIGAQMTTQLPDFSLDRYVGKYAYAFLGGPNGRVRFDYWPNGTAVLPR